MSLLSKFQLRDRITLALLLNNHHKVKRTELNTALLPTPPKKKSMLNNSAIHSPALAKLAKETVVQGQLPPGLCSPAFF